MENKERVPRGKLLAEEEDKKYGRWWNDDRGDKRRPILYTRIGTTCRPEYMRLSLLHGWQKHTPNWKKVVGEVYRKRWPGYKELCIVFFAEFAIREWSKRTLLETCHRLPFFGVNCTVQRGLQENHTINPKKPITILRETDYRIRPFNGKLRADYFSASGALIRNHITPLGKSSGKWIYEYPKNADPRIYRPSFPPPHTPPS